MNAEEFVKLVTEMRVAQKKYFKERTGSSLIESKKLEKQVDQVLETGLDNDTAADVAVQLSLTENGGGGKPKLLKGHQLSFLDKEKHNEQS